MLAGNEVKESDMCQVGVCTGKAHLPGMNPVQSFITGVIGCLLPGLTVNVIPNDCLLEGLLLNNKMTNYYLFYLKSI